MYFTFHIKLLPEHPYFAETCLKRKGKITL